MQQPRYMRPPYTCHTAKLAHLNLRDNGLSDAACDALTRSPALTGLTQSVPYIWTRG